jgi:hypothetical protein
MAGASRITTRLRAWILLTFLLIAPLHAVPAQSSWDRYKPGTLAAIMDPDRLSLVRSWGKTFRRDSTIAGDFHREYLFQEGKQLLWLPVQDTVASFFPKELHPGQHVKLYVMWLGAYYAGRDVIWAFVVNEFEADATKP